MNVAKKKYAFLNQFAKGQGTVLFGADTFEALPIYELAQDFGMSQRVYNRSFAKLTIPEATELLPEVLSNLNADTIIVNLGENEITTEGVDIEAVTEQYRWMLYKLHTCFSISRIVISSIALRTVDAEAFNSHLHALAKEFGCEYLEIPEKTSDMDQNEYSILLFRSMKKFFYDKNLSYEDIAKNAILYFS
jgi:hypothetical protein